MSLRSLISTPFYRVYERRLAGRLAGKPVPRHVGVMCDGNRRWAREMGFVDPNDGHRVGATRVKELLTWCDQAGIEHVTLYLLAPANPPRPGQGVADLVRSGRHRTRHALPAGPRQPAPPGRRAGPARQDHRGSGDRA